MIITVITIIIIAIVIIIITSPQYIDKPASEDSHFVAALKELGAIPFCLTNVPQTMVRGMRMKRMLKRMRKTICFHM